MSRMLGRSSRAGEGNRYDDPMVLLDVSYASYESGTAPGIVLVARLHVDLCRRTAAACPCA